LSLGGFLIRLFYEVCGIQAQLSERGAAFVKKRFRQRKIAYLSPLRCSWPEAVAKFPGALVATTYRDKRFEVDCKPCEEEAKFETEDEPKDEEDNDEEHEEVEDEGYEREAMKREQTREMKRVRTRLETNKLWCA